MNRDIVKPVSEAVGQLPQREEQQDPLVLPPTSVRLRRRALTVPLSGRERRELEALTRRTTAPVAHVQRAKIALLSADCVASKDIARLLVSI